MRLENKYNPYNQRFERVPEDWEIRYNHYSGEFEYAPPKSGYSFSYNTVEQTFSTIPGASPQYNQMEGRFEMGHDDWEPSYNIHENKFEIAPRETPFTAPSKKRDNDNW